MNDKTDCLAKIPAQRELPALASPTATSRAARAIKPRSFLMEPATRKKVRSLPTAMRESIAALLSAAEARIAELETALLDATTHACQDSLTGALNRRGLDRVYARETARAQRTGEPLALVLLDLDDFKSINDQHGHAVGDLALGRLTQVIAETLRPTDICCRWGGDEFVVVMPGADRALAKRALSRVQDAVSQQSEGHDLVPLTFSAGVVISKGGESLDHLVARADRAVYRAKAAGKHRTFIE